MTVTQRAIAEAFSSHRFDLVFPYLADDIRWNLVGAPIAITTYAVELADSAGSS